MAYYLVTARPRAARLDALAEALARDAYVDLRPFGRTLSASLRRARRRDDGLATWEEEDYCHPPLAEERAAVLDHYFDEIDVTPVPRSDGWRRIAMLPRLFPHLAEAADGTR